MSIVRGSEIAKEMARLEAEAAEKARKEAERASLLRQINEVQRLISDANSIKTELSTINSDISASIITWRSGRSSYQACSMSDVFVTNRFEGVVASVIQSRIPEPVSHMEKGIAAAYSAKDAISSQISRLNVYINTKGNLLSSLYGQLQAI